MLRNVASVMYKDGNVQVRSWKDARVSILISEPILVNMSESREKSVSHVDQDLESGIVSGSNVVAEFVKDTSIKTSGIRDA